MQITEQQLFDAAVAMVAGAMANPANAHLLHDQYGQTQALANSMQAVGQAMMQIGGIVVPNEPTQERP